MGRVAHGARTRSIVGGIDVHGGGVVLCATDASLPGTTFGWCHQRIYGSGFQDVNGSPYSGWNGMRWIARGEGISLRQSGTDEITLILSPVSKLVFTDSNQDGTYDVPGFYNATFVKTGSGASERFILVERDSGNVLYFYGYDNAISLQNRGALQYWTSRAYMAASKVGLLYGYNGQQRVSSVTTADDQTWSITYSNRADGGAEGGRLDSVVVCNGSSHPIIEVYYTYFGTVYEKHSRTPDDDLGSDGDLVQVKIRQRASNDTDWITRWTQYRYYRAGDSDGAANQLKMVLDSAAIERIIVDNANITTAEQILDKEDSYVAGSTATKPVKDFASATYTYYTSTVDTSNVNTPWASGENLHSKYGGSQRSETGMLKSMTNTGGCGACGGGGSGGVKQSYFYMQLNGGSSADPKVATAITVVDTEDADSAETKRELYSFNSEGVQLRHALIENPAASPLKAWCNSIKLNADKRVTEERMPSAHAPEVDTNSDLAKFLDPETGGNDDATLSASAGVIRVIEYNSDKYPNGVRVKQGRSNTSYYVSATDWGDGTNDKPKELVMATYRYAAATTTRGSGIATSMAYTFWDAGDSAVNVVTTTLPSISSGQNGSGTATSTKQYFDAYGRLRWEKDGEDKVTYHAQHPYTGGEAYTMVDVDTNGLPGDITSGSSGKWVAWGGGGMPSGFDVSQADTNLQLVTKTEYDTQGRSKLTIEPSTAQHYTVYKDNNTTIRFPYWDSGNSKCLVPIQVSKVNDGGVPTEQYAIRANYTSISTASSAPTGFSSAPGQTDYVSWTRYGYDAATGQTDTVDRYHDIPSSGTGTLSTNFYRSVTRHDKLGRVKYTVQVVSGTATSAAVEQIEQNIYDVLDRVIQTKRGVSNSSHNMQTDYGTLPTTPAPTLVSATEYDSGGVGDGHVTKTKRYYGTTANDYTGANRYYNFRGQLRGTEPFYYNSGETPIGPYSVQDVNWAGEVIASAQYTADPTWSGGGTGVLDDDDYAATISSNRETRSATSFDDLGRAYKREVYIGSNKRVFHTYYDRNSRQVASQEENGPATETAFDGAGRQYQSRTLLDLASTKYSSGVFQYQAPVPHPRYGSGATGNMSGGDGKVVTLSHSLLDASGNALERHSFEANHDDTDGISLSTPDYVRRTVYAWFDGADRETEVGDYGSGDATSGDGQWKYASLPTRGSAPTQSSETVLLTKKIYESTTGLVQSIITPATAAAGTTAVITTDDLGRRIKVVDGAMERTTLTQFNGLDSVVKLIADTDQDNTFSGGVWTDPDTENGQVTSYLYEDLVDASRQTNAIYPDSSDTDSTGTDQVYTGWNVDGTMAIFKRPGSAENTRTILEYTYNGRRQVELEKATQLGTDIDDHVKSIKHEYDTMGREEKTTSYQNNDGTGTVRNQVQRSFNPFSQLTQEWQSHEGTVTTGGGSPSPSVAYGYDASDASGVLTNGHRHKDTTYPKTSRVIFRDYGSSGGINDLLHRVKKLRETDGSGTVLVEYTHNGGGGMPVIADYPTPDVKLDLYQGTTGTYAGLDRFGRRKSLLWDNYGSTPEIDHFEYSYNYDSSPKHRDINSTSVSFTNNDKDQLFEHDSLHRLTRQKYGTLSSGAMSSPAKEQKWDHLDDLGNWTTYEEKVSGSTTLNQTRTNNKVNEITGIGINMTGDNWYDPTYDAAGNMRTGPKPGSPKDSDANGRKLRNTWDAWNRLVKIEQSATNADSWSDVITAEYDGYGRRIAKVDKTVSPNVTYDYYYDRQQIVETRQDADTDPLEQFVWHTYYIDALAVRYYDSDINGSGIVTHYFTHDANFNVTAATDSGGAVVERYEYTPYGTVKILEPDFSDDSDQLSDIGNTTLYTGRMLDTQSGYFYYRARYYDPGLGRFIGRDPIEYQGSINLYQYVGNSPTHMTDSMGLAEWIDYEIEDVPDPKGGVTFGAGLALNPNIPPGVNLDVKTASKIINDGITNWKTTPTTMQYTKIVQECPQGYVRGRQTGTNKGAAQILRNETLHLYIVLDNPSTLRHPIKGQWKYVYVFDKEESGNYQIVHQTPVQYGKLTRTITEVKGDCVKAQPQPKGSSNKTSCEENEISPSTSTYYTKLDGK